MPRLHYTEEQREKERVRAKQWRQANKEYVKLYNSYTTRQRSDEGKAKEQMRLKRNYEILKEYKTFRDAMPLFLTV